MGTAQRNFNPFPREALHNRIEYSRGAIEVRK